MCVCVCVCVRVCVCVCTSVAVLHVYSTVGRRRTGDQGSRLARSYFQRTQQFRSYLMVHCTTVLHVHLCRVTRLSVHYSVNYGFRSYLQKIQPTSFLNNW